MFRPLPDLPTGVIGFEAVGEIHATDYTEVLRPALDDAAASGAIRMVFVVGDEFTSYSTGASWEDAKLALHHLSAWERTALVSNLDWMRHAAAAFGWMVPGQMRTFRLDDRAEAVRWAAGEDTAAPVTPVVVEPPGVMTSVGATWTDEPAAAAPAAAGTDAAPAAEAVPAMAAGETGDEAVQERSDAPAEDADATVVQPAVAESDPTIVQPTLGSTLHEPQTMTPRAPLTPGADVRPGFGAGPVAGAPAAPAVPAQWAPDPSGRHQHRWWDGERWTEHVADNGISAVDPLR